MRRGLILAMCLLTGCSLMRRDDAPLAFHPAHWVDGVDHLTPDGGDFELNALGFASPDEGWVVGNRFALHISGERLEVAFLKPRDFVLWDVDLDAAHAGLAGGYRQPAWGAANTGLVLRYDGQHWHPDPVAPTLFPQWWIQRVAADPSGADRAIAAVFEGPITVIVPSSVSMRLLQHAADTWSGEGAPANAAWRANDLCTAADGATRMVGAVVSDKRHYRPLAARAAQGTWTEESVPSVAGDAATLRRVACPPSGGAVALGSAWREHERRTELVLLRFTERWQSVALPADVLQRDATAVAALSTDDIWLALSCSGALDGCQPRFLHWHDGQWTVSDPPPLPGGRVGGYTFTDLQFVSPDEGWAIANDYAGRGLSRGLLFHYRDGVWRLRNWDWHFWDQPGLGWFGD